MSDNRKWAIVIEKNAIKKFAIEARRELLSRVSQRALKYGISEKELGNPNDDNVGGHLLSSTEKSQRAALIKQIQEKGYEQVMEEVAYTWFNRFSALRFMEVNGFLPTRVRVFTDENNAFKPQILTEAIHMELDGLDMEKVYAYKEANDDDALYKYLLITQCNALNSVLPGMFQRIADYTELLFPDNLLREGSVVQQMVTLIPEDDWKDAVQIIGWLYQYYNSEKKDDVFAALKKNVKITKENIPAATQLFTPDWIVRYMVENSLGRLWVEGHPNDELKGQWKYYLEEAEQEPEVQAQLDAIREEYKALKPEDIQCIDPCSGSGHILAYMFDVLVQIYEAYGVDTRTAVTSIVENNLYGLDIDDRAAQLSYFAVMMKACQYDKRFLKRRDENGNPKIPQPKVFPILESGCVDKAGNTRFKFDKNVLDYFSNGDEHLREAIDTIIKELFNAKEYGSIIKVSQQDWPALYARFDEIADDIDMSRDTALQKLLPLVQVAETLAKKYNVVVTNPPYMGSSSMGANLSKTVKKDYPDSKSDLFAVFIERCGQMTERNGYQAMITQHAWMFLSSFEKLRIKLLATDDIVNMAHLGARAFEEIGGEVVQTASFVIYKGSVADYKSEYCRLVEPTTQKGKKDMFLAREKCYVAEQNNFSKIPGSPLVYWFGDSFLNSFADKKAVNAYGDARKGLVTLDNERFLRIWTEVSFLKVGIEVDSAEDALKHKVKWIPINKGGLFRKWYGNNSFVVNWENCGEEIKDNIVRTYRGGSYTKEVRSEDKYFLPGVTWTVVSTARTSFRRYGKGFIFSNSGESVTTPDCSEDTLDYLTGLLNSKYAEKTLAVLSPTMGFESGYIAEVPVPNDLIYKDYIVPIVLENVRVSKEEWDSFETSWDFQRHPLLCYGVSIYSGLGDMQLDGEYSSSIHIKYEKTSTSEKTFEVGTPPNYRLETSFTMWKQACESRFQQLKANEEELNRIFIDIYGLQDELTPEVADKDITVHRIFDTKEDVPESMQGSNYVRTMRDEIVSLISYAVGCMFGRYSLDVDGLVYAGGDFDTKYCRWIRQFGDAANEEIDENGELIDGGWAGCTLWEYDGVRKGGKWVPASYPPDTDNIIPISDDEYFEDDIVGRFVEFVRIVYGTETLDENLQFIADALGGKGTPKEVIRNYFLTKFYADHCKMYQKRPIYWLFDSGKKNGFKCLIYMHRYQPDTIARIRTDYVHEQQARYRTAIADLEQRIANAATGERVKLNKQLKKLNDQAAEILAYEEKIHHLADQMIPIDLDDGVKVNYAKFQDVLAKIK